LVGWLAHGAWRGQWVAEQRTGLPAQERVQRRSGDGPPAACTSLWPSRAVPCTALQGRLLAAVEDLHSGFRCGRAACLMEAA
jgi:hypothetical protein